MTPEEDLKIKKIGFAKLLKALSNCDKKIQKVVIKEYRKL